MRLDRVWISVGAAVYDEKAESFLLMQRADNGRWELPGGLVEPGELLTDAVVRETMEETGVEVRVIRPSGVYESPNHRVISFVFLCEPVSGHPTLSDETVDVRWVAKHQVKTLVNEAYSCRLLDALFREFHSRITDEDRLI